MVLFDLLLFAALFYIGGRVVRNLFQAVGGDAYLTSGTSRADRDGAYRQTWHGPAWRVRRRRGDDVEEARWKDLK